MLRSGAGLSTLGKGAVLTVAKCRLLAITIFATQPILIDCEVHRSGDTACLLQRRSRLRRAWDNELDHLLQATDVPQPIMASIFEQLANSPDPNSRLIPAQNPDCPPGIAAALAQDWWWEVRAGIAANPCCPIGVQQTLVADENPWVRRALAENLQAEPGLIGVMATDPDFGVRDAVAEHPHCPVDDQINLTKDDRWEIRRSIAKRQDAPVAALTILANDPEPWVRFFVAANPRTPDHLRAALLDDPDTKVRSMARHAHTATARLANSLAFGLNQVSPQTKRADQP